LKKINEGNTKFDCNQLFQYLFRKTKRQPHDEYFEKCVPSTFAPDPTIINFSKNVNNNDCFYLI